MFDHIRADRAKQYWLFQALGWTAMTVLSYLSLALWYHPGNLLHAIHTVIQSVLGFFVSIPLHHVARRLWRAPLVQRVVWITFAGLVASVAWTVLRIVTLDWMTGIYIQRADYGGWLFASIIVFASWLICYHSIKYYQLLLDQRAIAAEANNQAQLEMVRRLRAEAQNRDAQLRMLKYQLNPHFLFNALNSITALVRVGDKGAAEETVSRLAEFLRVILDHNDELDHTLEEEISNLELYLGIEKVRFEERMLVRTDLTPRAKSALVPSLLLQPLIENAIKHAVGKSLAPTTISLSASTFASPTGERLEIVVSDTGPNWSSAELELAPKGIGLTNTRRRLESYVDGKFTFELRRNEPQGLAICIEMPFIYRRDFARSLLATSDAGAESAANPAPAESYGP